MTDEPRDEFESEPAVVPFAYRILPTGEVLAVTPIQSCTFELTSTTSTTT
jgi:hypothetical protein